jgi:poly(hydroxyalkanoate) depolymerase family esterase
MNMIAPKRNMMQALRLTRDGKLKEAVAMLRGAPAEGAKQPHPSRPAPGLMDNLANISGTLQDALQRAGEVGRHAAAPKLAPGARFETRSFTNAAGARDYRLYVPSNPGAAMPLVIMLHGCTQSPEDFAAGTRMNELAARKKFLVAYPGQTRAANLNKCWNWYKPEEYGRGAGEASILAGIAQEIAAEFHVPRGRLYAAGLSAGGAQAANLATAYPELFAGVGIHSGLPSGAAHSLPSAMAAMKNGARATTGGGMTPTIVFQGDADHTVNPANAERIIAAFGPRVSVMQATAGDGAPYSKAVYAKAELWLLHGLGHGWSGGSPAGSFTEPRGPDASAEMVRFFGL